MNHDTAAFRNALNERIDEMAWKFGPVRIRTVDYRRPRHEQIRHITDRRGRRMAVSAGLDVNAVAARLHNRHMKRLGLDHEERRVRLMIEDEFKNLLRKPARVMLADADEDHRNSFMCFAVHVDLLDETLEWRPHLLDYRPYSPCGDHISGFVRTQRRRLRILGTQQRSAALTCCPVLAARITDADNPKTWAGMLEGAIDGLMDPGMPHFEDGRLIDVVEMTPGAYHAGRKGAWWRRNTLSLPMSLPESMAQALKGRPLSTVMEHPYLPKDAMITSVTVRASRTEVTARSPGVAFMPLYVGVLGRAEDRACG